MVCVCVGMWMCEMFVHVIWLSGANPGVGKGMDTNSQSVGSWEE